MIASMSVDAVALQELDLGRSRSAGVDQAQLIAAELGWDRLFHPAMRYADEQYGNAILSRHPLALLEAVQLPGEGSWYCREKRVAIWAAIETELGRVHVINTHFGLGRTDRLLQAQALGGKLAAASKDEPLLLLGDFNSRTASRSINLLRTHLRSVRALLPAAGLCRTFPTRFPVVAVDHIFVNEVLRPEALRVHRTPLARLASDHYPLVAELTRTKSPRSP